MIHRFFTAFLLIPVILLSLVAAGLAAVWPATEESLTGWLSVIWNDSQPGDGAGGEAHIYLRTDDDNKIRLVVGNNFSIHL
jgi:hypothetical protein